MKSNANPKEKTIRIRVDWTTAETLKSWKIVNAMIIIKRLNDLYKIWSAWIGSIADFIRYAFLIDEEYISTFDIRSVFTRIFTINPMLWISQLCRNRKKKNSNKKAQCKSVQTRSHNQMRWFFIFIFFYFL